MTEKYDKDRSCVGCVVLKKDLFSGYSCVLNFPIEVKDVEDYAGETLTLPHPAEPCTKPTSLSDLVEKHISGADDEQEEKE